MRSDQELLDAMAAGDEHAAALLYARHRDWALRVALAITRDEALALDACQDAWFQLARRARRNVTLRAAFTTFLYPYVRHAALKAKKRRGPVLRLTTDEPAPAQTDEHDGVLRAIGGLHESQAEVLRLRYWHGLSDAEIAAATGKPLGTVKGRLRAALRELAARLGEENTEFSPKP